MAETEKPLLIKRYASRRLYNTETSDYVTLEDIAEFIRDGREVQIIDLKSGDDLTRQYLLQIIAEHEGRGENVLPLWSKAGPRITKFVAARIEALSILETVSVNSSREHHRHRGQAEQLERGRA